MSRPTLTTQRLILRPFDIRDAPEVTRLVSDRRIADTTLNIPHPYDESMAVAWIGTHEEAAERGDRIPLAITEKGGGVLGAVALAITHAHQRAELGYWIGVPYWRRGYATEAATAMLDHAFSTLDLRRVDAHCLTRNVGSARVMEKIGMRHEGTLRAHVLKWDVPEDVALYAILRDEWSRLTRESGSAH